MGGECKMGEVWGRWRKIKKGMSRCSVHTTNRIEDTVISYVLPPGL